MSRIYSSLITILISCVFFSATSLAQNSALKIIAIDEAGKPLSAVKVEIKKAGAVVARATTDENGIATISKIGAGTYELNATKEGFEPRTKNDLLIESNAPVTLELLLVPKVNITDTVNVTATNAAVNPVENAASTSTDIQRKEAKDSTIRPHTVEDALPLVPGVVRDAQGKLSIAGGGENRSALLVNAMDVTDPATGQFGMTIPIDSVESLNVYKSPFLAQYGRFSAGVVSVETRRGGDKWNFELNDPLPEFRYLGGHLRGLFSATPRVIFNGPLIKNKLYISQGTEYAIKKNRVLALPFPVNESVNESINSFTQLDYIGLQNHAITGTIHIAPRQSKFWNLDFFNRRPVTPNFRGRDYTGTVIDRWTLGTNLLESTFAVKKARLGVWGQGVAEMNLIPTGNTGNYFNEQQRESVRLDWQETFSLHPVTKFGTHNFKFGTGVTRTTNDGSFTARPVNIRNTNGQLLKRIEFTGGASYDRKDLEVAIFAQDHWLVTQKFALDLGLRTERQNITKTFRIAPRVGFVWTPFGNQRSVIRAGYGLFYDRVPLNVYSFSSYPDQVITTYDGNGNIVDNARRWYNITGIAQRNTPFVRGNSTSPGNFAPYTATTTLEFEQPINQHLRFRVNYQRSDSKGLIITTPQIVAGQNALVLNGTGRSRYQQLEITSRINFKEEQQLFASYVRSRTRGDLNEFNSYLGSFPFPVIRPNQYSNLPGDLPHRFLAWGVIKVPWKLYWSPMVEVRSGFPYAVVDANQNYVGVPNNDKYRFPKFFSFDSRVRRDFKVNDKYSVRISVSGFNLTNHFNPPSLHNNVADPQYGLFFGQNKRRIRVDFDVIF